MMSEFIGFDSETRWKVEEEEAGLSVACRILGQLRIKAVLQRLPGIITVFFLFLCFFGPVYLPNLYAVYFSWLHIYFVWSTLRTLMSSYSAFHHVVAHTNTDWQVKFNEQRQSFQESENGIYGNDGVLEFEDVVHVIILPQYKEELDTMTETLNVLASHGMAKTNYKIVLAMEQGEKEAPAKASELITNFRHCFQEIVFTLHPRGIPGEIRGKSSNTAWAARQILSSSNPVVSAEAGQKNKEQVITVMDADTCFAADYFEAISFHFASTPSRQERDLLFFSTPTLFDRNSDKVPFLVRAYDMQWSMGVLSNFHPFSRKQAPCSAYSLSAALADSVGGWDTDAGAIGEDLHTFLKCFFATQAQLKVLPIYSPASQCNIQGSGKGYWSGVGARYTQSKRHMWASLDVGYVIRKSLFAIFAPGYDAPFTDSAKVIKSPLSPSSRYHLPTLVCRCWSIFYTILESHFFVTQTLVMIATSSVLIPPGIIPGIALPYWSALSSTPIDQSLITLNIIANYLRIVATLFYVAGVYCYEKYQAWCGIYRWKEQGRQSRLGIRSKLQFSRPWYSVFDWLAFPITGVLYLVLPQLQVHISQLFFEELDYVVAAKPKTPSDEKPAPLDKGESAVTIVVSF